MSFVRDTDAMPLLRHRKTGVLLDGPYDGTLVDVYLNWGYLAVYELHGERYLTSFEENGVLYFIHESEVRTDLFA